jgi:1-phosphatidylinositol phosphodiesterase
MTDNWETIKSLKVEELLLTSAHHSGFDQDNSSWPEEMWGACQDYDCYTQLRDGVRVLDLRLIDNATDTSDRFQFKHGSFCIERYAHDCGEEVDRFLTENPEEFVILDFHTLESVPSKSFDFIRMLRDFPTNRGVPVQAQHLTLDEIRQQHPGRNLIFASNNQFTHWPKILHKWSGHEYISANDLIPEIKTIMKAPPINRIWSLSAASFIIDGPERIPSDHQLWTTIFSPLYNPTGLPFIGNIINVDFYNVTGAIDHCIAITKERGIIKKTLIPTNFKAAEIWDNGFLLTWSAPQTITGILSHYVLIMEGSAPIETSDNSFIITDLSIDTEYKFLLYPVNDAGEKSGEVRLSIKTSPTPNPRPGPHKPYNAVAGKIKETSATLQWTPPASGEPVARWVITDEYGESKNIADNFLELTDLKINTVYTFDIRSQDTQGRLSDKVVLSFRTADATLLQPNNISAHNVTSSAATIRWGRPSGESRITGYQFSRNGVALFTTPDLEYRATWLSHSRTYLFEVRSRDQHGNLSIPAECSVTTAQAPSRPGPPTNLKLETNPQPLLSWMPPFGGNVANYIIYRNGSQWAGALLPICSIKLPEVYGEDYCYDVCSRDLEGQLSDPATIILKAPTPTLSAPANLEFNDVKDTSGRIQWDASTGNIEVVAYEITISDRQPILVSATLYEVVDLEKVAPFDVKIRAKGPNGYFSEYAYATFHTKAWLEPPGKPEISHIRQNSAYVSWAPSSSSHPIKGYQVSVWTLMLDMGPETHRQVNGLKPGIYYVIRVEAEDILGNRSTSESSSFMTLKEPPPAPPEKPGNLRITAQNSDSVSLAWDKGQGESAVTEYRVENDRGYDNTTPDTTLDIENLSPGINYIFTVRAMDQFQQVSEPTEILVSITHANPPSNFQVLPAALGCIKIGFNPPAEIMNLKRYKVLYKRENGEELSIYVAADRTVANIVLLLPKTLYRIKIIAEYKDDTESPPLIGEAKSG